MSNKMTPEQKMVAEAALRSCHILVDSMGAAHAAKDLIFLAREQGHPENFDWLVSWAGFAGKVKHPFSANSQRMAVSYLACLFRPSDFVKNQKHFGVEAFEKFANKVGIKPDVAKLVIEMI